MEALVYHQQNRRYVVRAQKQKRWKHMARRLQQRKHCDEQHQFLTKTLL